MKLKYYYCMIRLLYQNYKQKLKQQIILVLKTKQKMKNTNVIIQDIQLLKGHKHIEQIFSKSDYQYQLIYFPSTLSNPYCRFKWHIKISLNQQYPKIAPQIFLLDPIYHLNVANNGKISMAILNRQWSSLNNFNYIIDQLDNLLDLPDSNNPANQQAFKLFTNNQGQYFKKVDLELDHKKSQYVKNSSHEEKSDCQRQLLSGLNQMKLSKFSSFANTVQGKTSLPINLKYGQYNLLLNSPKQSCIEPIRIKNKNQNLENQLNIIEKNSLQLKQKKKQDSLKQRKKMVEDTKMQLKNQNQKKSNNFQQSKPSSDEAIKKEANVNIQSQFAQINIKSSQLWVRNISKSFGILKQERVINQSSSLYQQNNQKNALLDKTFQLIQKLGEPSNDLKLNLENQRQKVNQKIGQQIYQILLTFNNSKIYTNQMMAKVLTKKINNQIQLLQTLLNLQYEIKIKKIKLLQAQIKEDFNL